MMSMQEMPSTLTIAAISDTHFGSPDRPEIPTVTTDHIRDMSDSADLIVHCGDFTDYGDLGGARLAANLFRESDVPVFGVLGNHDFNPEDISSIRSILEEDGGIQILRGDTYTMQQNGSQVTFLGASGYQWRIANKRTRDQETLTKLHSVIEAELNQFTDSINTLNGNNNVILLHYQPVRKPRHDKKGRQHGMLRSSRYGQLIDTHKSKIKLILHGHDHGDDSPEATGKGVDMINIASPVTVAMTPGTPYRLITLQLKPAA